MLYGTQIIECQIKFRGTFLGQDNFMVPVQINIYYCGFSIDNLSLFQSIRNWYDLFIAIMT